MTLHTEKKASPTSAGFDAITAKPDATRGPRLYVGGGLLIIWAVVFLGEQFGFIPPHDEWLHLIKQWVPLVFGIAILTPEALIFAGGFARQVRGK